MLGGEYTSRYTQIQLLGRNVQDDSQIFLVKDAITQQYKMAKKLSILQSEFTQQSFLLNEVTLLKELNHPHILKYHDIHLDGQILISILQFCEEGDLANYIQKKKIRKEMFSQKLLLSWLMQILMGLEHIHNKHIIHRLISTKNVYLNHQGDLKIGSFGHAKVLQNTMKKALTVVTAPCYMSPQMVKDQPYNSKADIWALGCLIYQLATLKPLYTYTNLPQLYDLIVEKSSPELPIKYAKYLTPLYRKMMKKNPSARPSASQLLQEEIFLNLMKQYIKKKKIDSLDLKYLVPKTLSIHRAKEQSHKKQKVKLPPISPHNMSSANITPSKKNKIQSSNTQNRPFSKEKKTAYEIQNKPTSPKQKQPQNITQRITKINEKQGLKISNLYENKLYQIMQKYKPNMSSIYQKTFQFQELLQ